MGGCAGGQNQPACAVVEADLSEDGVLAVVSMALRRGASVYRAEVGVIGSQAGQVKGSRGVTYDEDGDVVMSGW